MSERQVKQATTMKVSAITCEKCLDTVYSRARHDFRSCTCGAVSIDGGPAYTKICYPGDTTPPKIFDLDIGEITAADLYNDWNKRIDKYGIIKGGKLET